MSSDNRARDILPQRIIIAQHNINIIIIRIRIRMMYAIVFQRFTRVV